MKNRIIVTMLVLGFVLGLNGVVHASGTSFLVYDAGTAGNPVTAPDPTAVGWTLSGAADPGITVGDVSPDGATGLNAWNVNDNTEASGKFQFYMATLTQEEQAVANQFGWEIKTTARHITNFGGGVATHFYFADENKQNYLVWFWLDEDAESDSFGDLFLQIHGGPRLRVTYDGRGADNYHDYKIRFDSAKQSATLSADDVVLLEDWTGVFNTYADASSVEFGSSSSGGQGSTNYNFISFRLLPDPIESIVPEEGLTVTEGLTDGAAYKIRVNPDPNYPTVQVDVTVTPEADLDVGAGAGQPIVLNFPVSGEPNDYVQAVTVYAVDDEDVEGPHTRRIMHTSSSANSSWDNWDIVDVFVDVIDNDGEPGIIVSADAIYVEEGGSGGQFTIVLATPPAPDRTVTIATTPADGQVEDPNDIVFNARNWSMPQTVTVAAVDDADVEGTHFSAIQFSVNGTDPTYNGWALDDVGVMIGDNEQQGPTALLPYAWYRADAGAVSATGLAQDGENVIFIADSSGNLRNLNNPSNGGPVYVADGGNGMPHLRFNDWESIWISAGDFGTLTQPNTIFLMSMWDEQYTAGDGGDNSMMFDGASSSGRQAFTAARQDLYEVYTGAGAVKAASTEGDRGNTLLHSIVFNGANTEHYINGQLVQAGDGGSGNGLAGMVMGARISLNNALEGHINEMILYPGALSEADRQEIEEYLLIKWVGWVGIYEHNGFEFASTNVVELIDPNTDTYDVVLFGAPTADVSVTCTPENADLDLGAGPGNPITLTFTGPGTQQVTVQSVDNTTSDGPRVVKIIHTSSSGDGSYDNLMIRDVNVNLGENEDWCGQPGTMYWTSDINQDCYVNLLDFAIAAQNWMLCTHPFFLDDCLQELP